PTVEAAAGTPHGGWGGERSPYPGCDDIESRPAPGPVAASGWGSNPGGRPEVVRRRDREYPAVPLAVTENGAAFDDLVTSDGRVLDQGRIDFLDGHFRVSAQAMEAGGAGG